MTKLSDVRKDFEADAGGQWWHWRGSIYIKLRGFLSKEYQRELRLAKAEVPAPTAAEGSEKPSDAAMDEYYEKIGERMIPHIAELVLVDWWGVDAEAEPENMNPTPLVSEVTKVATVGGVALETIVRGDKQYRPLAETETAGRPGSWFQQMTPYSAAESLRTLQDPKCGDLLAAVRGTAQQMDVRRVERDYATLGKSSATSSGKSPTATMQKK